MPFEKKVSYLVENLRALPDDLAEEGIDILAQVGETEYATVLARDKGMVDKAIAVLVDAGEHLWAALIAKNSGLDSLSQNLYRDGLQYYIGMHVDSVKVQNAKKCYFLCNISKNYVGKSL